MPRAIRLDAPGILHHVIIRGIERRRIFFDDADRDGFLGRLGPLLTDTGTVCCAWALLPNHAHLLFRTGLSSLASLMRRLLTGYAVSFNHRHRRHGQLFQNRYKSIICEEDTYFRELVRYIHLNPIRARLVADLASLNDYPYSGHSAIVGTHPRDWQDVSSVLALFGARERYVSYVAQGVGDGRKPELVGGGIVRSHGGWEAVKKLRQEGQDRVKGDERILGSTDFVMKILAKAEEKLTRAYAVKAAGYGFEELEEKVLGLFGVERAELYARSRRKHLVEARSLLCYWAVDALEMSATELARRLGLTQPAIGYAVSRGKRIAREGGYHYADEV